MRTAAPAISGRPSIKPSASFMALAPFLSSEPRGRAAGMLRKLQHAAHFERI